MFFSSKTMLYIVQKEGKLNNAYEETVLGLGRTSLLDIFVKPLINATEVVL